MKITWVHFALRLELTISLFVVMLIDMAEEGGVLVNLIGFEDLIWLLWEEFILEEADEFLDL